MCLEELRKIAKNFVRLADLQAEILTGDVWNTKLSVVHCPVDKTDAGMNES